MAPTRPTTPPRGEMEVSRPLIGLPPRSLLSQDAHYPRSGMIMGSEPAMMPPSPAMPVPGFDTLTMSAVPCSAVSTRKGKGGKDKNKHGTRTGAGVKKTQPKQKMASKNKTRFVDAAMSGNFVQMPFRFMDLPGELRNEVYEHIFNDPKQALLVHRPRLATLRSSTRIDRGRTLPSDINEREHQELSTGKNKSRGSTKPNSIPRDSNRPFWGLTQVCQQLRKEFRPIYMYKQEVGIDLTEIVSYLHAFYSTVPNELSKLAGPGERETDMPFVGNLTIAVGDRPNELERSKQGIEIVSLLEIWANSIKIEAGFGRYMKPFYAPETDGEAKDLYRLFGRRVLKNRCCSGMNIAWRTALRTRALASVRIHRKPETVFPVPPLPPIPPIATPFTKPYIHIIFKKAFARRWMTEFESVIPKCPDWIYEHGFNAMEHFDIRVGVEQVESRRFCVFFFMSFTCHLTNNFDDTFCCHANSDSDAHPSSPHPTADMSRPQSMPDFSALMESSTSLFESSRSMEKRIHSRRQTSPERRATHARTKPSLSLAAGLMMNADSPLPTGSLPPRRRSSSRLVERRRPEMEDGDSLFYAYALRSDYPSSPPYILTFASAVICSQWWALVQAEYTASSRPSPQFFVIKSEDMELIQDDTKFFHLRDKWFYTSQDSPTCPPIVLPLQHTTGTPAVVPSQPAQQKADTATLDSLTESLARLAKTVESNAEQVHALSVAQSTGLQAMQEINESNSIQIKAIAESQIKLQGLVDQNASHYIALSNQSFQSQEQSRQAQEQTCKAQVQTQDILKTTISQLQTLAKNQTELSHTCEGLLHSIENISNCVSHFTSNAISDTASSHSLCTTSFDRVGSPIRPGPRKLNRRVKGVWYEYDSISGPSETPRQRVDSGSMLTPPKSPTAFKHA
ncbi:hypothetical protein GMOD_00001548 [Pyrenophora seminiperda CCB06]|uniref:Uncharacterized protein n=1 Tax=Pyrenophora seminiperda CCB06 TaxID=1302712 RepID=A0A3M7LZL9_9PLEO|nr:hypothetical protein GMOD_00001548 [Pyrenophora seminiperda CCB06]